MMRRAACLAVALLAVTACPQRRPELAGSRWAGIGRAELVSEYRLMPSSERSVALLHVLFVPEVEESRDGYSQSGSSSGGGDHYALAYSYHDHGLTIVAQPVAIHDNRVVEAGGRRFDLTRGNVFIAHVARNGAVDLTQLSVTRQDEREPAESVLAAIQAAVPNDARVHALSPPR
jgi:hypothetical protein